MPCIFNVDLEYSKELHDNHNNCPLAPQRLMINRVERLIPNLYDKERYIVHHKSLKLFLDLRLKIKKIHRGICLKKYIELNINIPVQKQRMNLGKISPP